MRLDKEVGTLNREIVAIKDKWKIALNIDSKKIAIEKLITLRKLRDNKEVSEKIERATKEEDLRLNQVNNKNNNSVSSSSASVSVSMSNLQTSQSLSQQNLINNNSFASNNPKVSAQKVTQNLNNIQTQQQNGGFGSKDNRESLNEEIKINNIAKQQINKQNTVIIEPITTINQSATVIQDNNLKSSITSKNTTNINQTNQDNINKTLNNSIELKETQIDTIQKVSEEPTHLTVAWLKQRMKGK